MFITHPGRQITRPRPSGIRRSAPRSGGPLAGRFDAFDRMTREMNRLFEDAAGRASTRGTPGLNVWRDGDALIVEAEIPGFRGDEIEVLATEDNLTLRGTRRNATPEHATPIRVERTLSTFDRSLSLPVAIEPDGVEAALTDGVLRVSLPIAEAARPRRVSVRQTAAELPAAQTAPAGGGPGGDA